MARIGGIVGALLLVSGCMTTTVHRAQTLGKGNFEVAIEPGVSGGNIQETSATLPTFNIMARGGISDRVDLGGRLGSGLIELHTNFLLTNLESDVRVALAPNVMPLFVAVGGESVGAFLVSVPVLVGIPTGEHELVLGPGFRSSTFVGAGENETLFEPTISLGYSLQLGDNVRLHPEFGYAIGVGRVGSVDDLDVATNTSRFAATLGLQFGRYGL